MKKIIATILAGLLVCLLPLIGFSQKAPIKFGDVQIEQVKEAVYAKDTAASAYYLADYGKSEIAYVREEGFQLNFDRLTRIKIVNKEGLDYANFSISVYHEGESREKITGLRAVTYNLENGKVVESKAKGDAIFREKRDENWDVTKITLPNVKAGSVVEIAYSITSDFLFNFHDWDFQYPIPVVWSEYRATIPEYFNYERYTQGYLAMTQHNQTESRETINLNSITRGGGTGFSSGNGPGTINNNSVEYRADHFRWVMQDVPAFKEEPQMTNASDYNSKIKFELTQTAFPNQPVKHYRGSWETVNSQLLESEYLGKAGRSSNYLNKIVEENTAGITNQIDKINALYSFVRKNTEWDGDFSKYCMIDFKKVLENKKGNSADINLLLVSMLQRAGFIANPVLISTRNHGFIRENVAVSSQFNYVIAAVKIGDSFLLLDATDHSLPVNLLPKRCLNGQGYMLSSVEPGWLPLVAGVKSRAVTNIDLSLQADGVLKGKVSLSREGYYAQEWRKSYNTKGEQDYCKDLASQHSWELHKSEFTNVDKLAEPFDETHQITIAEQVQSGGNLIYLNPLLFHQLDDNPFKATERHYPVDFGHPFQELYTGKIGIPEGFVVEEMPKPKVLTLPNNVGRYLYSITQIGNSLAVTSQFSINSALFTQEEYAGLREFYAQVVAKQSEQIVLKKK